MKCSLNWLKDYVDLPQDLDIATLAHDLTMSTVEVEGYASPAAGLDGIVVGQILSVAPHPDADKLRVVMTQIGSAEPSQIVCGGSNLTPGQKVAVAVPGAWVRWHGQGEPVEIKAAKLRGVLSQGMICGASELDLDLLFPVAEEHEIMDLSGLDAAPGTSLAEALGLDDWILEIDNKSMTHRPDLWGHYGMARELAAIYQRPLKALPTFERPADVGDYSVVIEAPEDCRRYIGAVYEGVRNEPSPLWMQTRLWSVGQRPVNLVVDITNYVMMATGQPTHGFDETHVHGGIVVRRATDDEHLELLDRRKLHLSSEDLVICDHRGPLALAGIMGGARDSILSDTTRLVLEVANFRAQQIRRTATGYNHRTEASTRFEKAIDTQRCDAALALAHQLITELMPEAKLTAYGEAAPIATQPAEVDVKLSFLGTRLGRAVTADEVERLIQPLGFQVQNKDEGTLTVTAPSWRSTGDISLAHDILEEVARMIGYDNFEFEAPTVTLDGPVHQPRADLDRAVRTYLATRAGFHEVLTYPWIDDRYIRAAGLDAEPTVNLANPPAPTQRRLRRSLVPGLLEATAKNLRYRERFRLFEVTSIFRPGSIQPAGSPEHLPEQVLHLGAALVAPERSDPLTLLREARGIIEALPRTCMCETLTVLPGPDQETSAPPWSDPQGWYLIQAGDQTIGCIGLVSLKSMSDADIDRARIVMIELNMDALVPLASRDNGFEPLPVYPQVDGDLSLVVRDEILWSDIEAVVLVQSGVKRVRFLEEYRGAQIPEGHRSVSLRFWIGSDERTLTSEDIEASRQRILKKLAEATGAELRA